MSPCAESFGPRDSYQGGFTCFGQEALRRFGSSRRLAGGSCSSSTIWFILITHVFGLSFPSSKMLCCLLAHFCLVSPAVQEWDCGVGAKGHTFILLSLIQRAAEHFSWPLPFNLVRRDSTCSPALTCTEDALWQWSLAPYSSSHALIFHPILYNYWWCMTLLILHIQWAVS